MLHWFRSPLQVPIRINIGFRNCLLLIRCQCDAIPSISLNKPDIFVCLVLNVEFDFGPYKYLTLFALLVSDAAQMELDTEAVDVACASECEKKSKHC